MNNLYKFRYVIDNFIIVILNLYIGYLNNRYNNLYN